MWNVDRLIHLVEHVEHPEPGRSTMWDSARRIRYMGIYASSFQKNKSKVCGKP